MHNFPNYVSSSKEVETWKKWAQQASKPSSLATGLREVPHHQSQQSTTSPRPAEYRSCNSCRRLR